jgi:hypothetical protein
MIQSIENGRKEDGNRSIADKIIKRLHDLDKTVENNRGRWAWELLQNAKDSIYDDDNRSVSIRIIFTGSGVEFKHDGTHFTEQDVRGLINQISSKEVEEGQHTKKTGRFGTGFLTTHILSKIIHVKGVVETVDNQFYSFQFPLDRQGKTTAQLIPKIENAWAEFHKSAKKLNSNYDQEMYNTSFYYHLETEEQREIARIGVKEFTRLVPFVLAFIPKIKKIEIIDETINNKVAFDNKQDLRNNSIIAISKTTNETPEDVLILYAANKRVSVATEIEKTTKGYSVKSINEIPKLFCDFPLIGTETFFFPVIVNSFFFNPQTERDGIWLKGIDDVEVSENQIILQEAVELYNNLVTIVTEGEYFDLYNLAETRTPIANEKHFDDKWYRDSIQKQIREIVYNSRMVELEGDENKKGMIKDLWFPLKQYPSLIQDRIWEFAYDLYPDFVCKSEHLSKWCDLSWEQWNKINYAQIVSDVAALENTERLCEVLVCDEKEAFKWLNAFLFFVLEDEANLSLFENSAIIPNQNKIFRKKNDLYIDRIKDDKLVAILELLDENWKNILLHDEVACGRYLVKEKKDIASKITEKLKRPLNHDDRYIKAITALSEWFENNQQEGSELFAELYRIRAELFMNTIEDKESLYEVMRTRANLAKLAEIAKAITNDPELIENIKRAEEFTSLLKEFNASDATDLKRMLLLAQRGEVLKEEITKETLVSLGVTSIKEFEEAFKNEDISQKFVHVATPTPEMFDYAQKLITRAKANIISYLSTLSNYDCTEMEELANTVIGGIKKDGALINIVTRPSDNGQVIIYYDSEKDALDYANAELWIDNGIEEPRHLTLGKILKNIRINKIPV